MSDILLSFGTANKLNNTAREPTAKAVLMKEWIKEPPRRGARSSKEVLYIIYGLLSAEEVGTALFNRWLHSPSPVS